MLWCRCGSVGVMVLVSVTGVVVLVWWCSCGGVSVVELAWWCWWCWCPGDSSFFNSIMMGLGERGSW